MRAKQIWDFLPLPAKLKLMWERISLTRITLIYFAFSVVHCAIQVGLQIQAFSINQQAAILLDNIVIQGDAKLEGFPVLRDDLRVCDKVPKKLNAESCQVVWAGLPFNRTTAESTSNYDVLSGYTSSSSASVVSSSSVILSSTPSPSSSSSVATSTITEVVLPSGLVVQAAVTSSAPLPTRTVTIVVVPTVSPSTISTRAKRMDSVKKVQIKAVNIDGEQTVALNGLGYENDQHVLSRKCIVSLNWPVMKLNNTKREDITLVAFQFWVLGMSIVALLNESIPHTIASLVTHMLSTAWTGFQISHTSNFRADFNRLTTNGTCGENLLASYWKARSEAEIPSLVLNIVALLISAFLSWRIIKLFGWQTFKRVGASIAIKRVYMLVLVLSIDIQLALFFLVTTLGVWVDQLCNGAIGQLAHHPTIYRTIVIIVGLLLVPWLMLGWFAVRREHRPAMAIFLALSLGYIVGLGAMFDATTFRWTFVEWRFFSIITSASALFTLCAFILGVICRLNFGKGLPQHLTAQESLPGDDFEPVGKGVEDVERGEYNDEKVDFPSTSAPVPTWHAAYGNGSGDFAPNYSPPRSVSPADSSPSYRFPSPADTVGPRLPSPAHTRSPTLGSVADGAPIGRHGSIASQRSMSSVTSENSTTGFGRSKRWVIE